MVFYRKYRPQTIAELDSAALRDRLYGIFSKPDVPHAFLFTGPKGTGKTSTARIIAKIVNCENNAYSLLPIANSSNKKEKVGTAISHTPFAISQIEPCNTCEQCLSITTGTNVDVLEIDGASNRGIDEIRDLREKVRLAPSHSRMKVYIIDEVHMLTTEAFNALLKTIEEPPAHVMFIFCTTEPHKVPETIVSRCTHIALTKGTETEVIHSLEEVAKKEGLDVEPQVFSMIANMADGGFRDAKKIFEEIVSLSENKKVTVEHIEKTYHVASRGKYATDILTQIFSHNAKEAIASVEQARGEDVDMIGLIDDLLSALHEHLLSLVTNKTTSVEQNMSSESLSTISSLLVDAREQTKRVGIPQLPLELAIVAYCGDHNLPESPNSDEDTSSHSVEPEPEKKIMAASTHPTVSMLLKKQQMMRIHDLVAPKKPVELIKKPSPVRDQVTASDTITLLDNIIHKVKGVNNPLSGVLRSVVIKEMSSDGVIFETKYAFHKERLEETANYAIIEKALRELTGKQLKVLVELIK